MTIVYKICSASIWQQAETERFFLGSWVDLIDGFIHFSSADQVVETARLHFAGESDLVLIEVDSTKIELVWEESRGGQLFPHLYGQLPLSAVVSVSPLFLTADGVHEFPQHFQVY